MEVAQIWLSMCRKTPKLLDEDTVVEISARELRKIVEQSHAHGRALEAKQRKPSVFESIFG